MIIRWVIVFAIVLLLWYNNVNVADAAIKKTPPKKVYGKSPTKTPTKKPTKYHSNKLVTKNPTKRPTKIPIKKHTKIVTKRPSIKPSLRPSVTPTSSPTSPVIHQFTLHITKTLIYTNGAFKTVVLINGQTPGYKYFVI